MVEEITLQKLKTLVDKRSVYLLIGHGSKNQFADINDVEKAIDIIISIVPDNAIFFYFGDGVNKDKPDIGYAFSVLVKKLKPTQNIIMIQINEAKSWGYPDFVKYIYWHDDYPKEKGHPQKWGGIDLASGQPVSNTKVFMEFINSIRCVFILGGGPITRQEYNLIKNRVDYLYFALKRRYLGDGKTPVPENASEKDMYGDMYEEIGNQKVKFSVNGDELFEVFKKKYLQGLINDAKTKDTETGLVVKVDEKGNYVVKDVKGSANELNFSKEDRIDLSTVIMIHTHPQGLYPNTKYQPPTGQDLREYILDYVRKGENIHQDYVVDSNGTWIIESLTEELKKDIPRVLRYVPDSENSIFSVNYVEIFDSDTKKEEEKSELLYIGDGELFAVRYKLVLDDPSKYESLYTEDGQLLPLYTKDEKEFMNYRVLRSGELLLDVVNNLTTDNTIPLLNGKITVEKYIENMRNLLAENMGINIRYIPHDSN